MDEVYFNLSYGGQTIRLLPWIEEMKWSINDLDGPEAGRTLDTKMWRDKLGEKVRFDIKLIAIETSKLIPIMQMVRHQFIELDTNIIPLESPASVEIYNSTRSGQTHVNTDKKIIHTNVTFNVIER